MNIWQISSIPGEAVYVECSEDDANQLVGKLLEKPGVILASKMRADDDHPVIVMANATTASEWLGL